MSRYSRWVLLGAVTAGVGLWPVAGVLAAEGGDACAMLQKADVEVAFAPRKFDSGKPGYAVKGSRRRRRGLKLHVHISRRHGKRSW